MFYGLTVYDLTCNHTKNPVGIGAGRLNLSWKMRGNGRCQYQTAYRIIASSTLDRLNNGDYDLWDTGRVENGNSIYISYEGKQLKSGERCLWKVMVWDQDGISSDWSPYTFFELGLLKREDWHAKWIGNSMGYEIEFANNPAPHFRKEFLADDDIKCARAYISGVGFYELRINGHKVGDRVLTPLFTKYDKTVLYDTIDITDSLVKGQNTLGVVLGNGWYNSNAEDVWNFNKAPWRNLPKFILQIHIDYIDGKQAKIISDASWKTSGGPIVFDCLRNGEYYDARKEITGWDMPGYNDSGWNNATIVRAPGGILKPNEAIPTRVTQTIKAKSLSKIAEDIWVYDFGQNLSGWVRFKGKGSKGTEVAFKYGERLRPDGSVDQEHISVYVKTGEFQTDKYTMKGTDIEVWEPRFIYHGFQYVEIRGYNGTPTEETLTACVVHTDFEERGDFECSNELFNAIQHCARWSALTNFHGFPEDCPHREKNGWTGDALLSAEQMLLNFNPTMAYNKWLEDFKDEQRPNGQLPGIIPTAGWGYIWGSGPAWDSAIVLIPWYIYLYTGDMNTIKNMYSNMKKYVDYMTDMADGYIVNFGLGDWCHPVKDSDYPKCSAEVTDTAYYYVDTLILAKVAGILGFQDDEARYDELARDIKVAFQNCFIKSETGIVQGNCQTSLACALYQGLVDDRIKELSFDRLVEQVEAKGRHIDCGILGAKYILHTLTRYGRTDLAYAIADQRTYPGWGYFIEQGATTLWETWDGDCSLNHHMFSDISAWFYKGLAGIYPNEKNPGFKHITICPKPINGLTYVSCRHESMYGRIVSDWSVEGDIFTIKLTIPVNCTATFVVPEGYRSEIIENGIPVDQSNDICIKQEGSNYFLTFGSGEYSIVCIA